MWSCPLRCIVQTCAALRYTHAPAQQFFAPSCRTPLCDPLCHSTDQSYINRLCRRHGLSHPTWHPTTLQDIQDLLESQDFKKGVCVCVRALARRSAAACMAEPFAELHYLPVANSHCLCRQACTCASHLHSVVPDCHILQTTHYTVLCAAVNWVWHWP